MALLLVSTGGFLLWLGTLLEGLEADMSHLGLPTRSLLSLKDKCHGVSIKDTFCKFTRERELVLKQRSVGKYFIVAGGCVGLGVGDREWSQGCCCF